LLVLLLLMELLSMFT